MTPHKRLAVLGNGDAEMKRSAGVANFHHDFTLRFARQQSQETRSMEWESRLSPLRPWSFDIVAGAVICFVLFLALLELPR